MFIETTLNHTTVLKNGFEQRRNYFQTMTDNNDEPFSIIIDKSNYFSFNSYLRGYKIYEHLESC